jgi:putative ABC transport system permease protein
MNFFIELKEGLGIAWDAIYANKLRSILTTIGIIIGIVTVTLMGTAIDGLNRAFHQGLSIMGADVLFVNRFSWLVDSEDDLIKSNKRREISMDEVKAVEQQMPMARAIAPVVQMSRSVRYKNKSAGGVIITGSTDQFLITGGFGLSLGRFMTPEESSGGRPVCVIGNDVATNLFINESPLGKQIRIGPRKLEVIGVLEKRGSFLGLKSFDNEVIIPIEQLLIGYWRNPDFMIEVKVDRLEHLAAAKEELRGLMRKIRHVAPGDPDSFAINQQEQFLEKLDQVTAVIASIGLTITGLSLFVGGIGIMNIMFVSVAERTREIGVRKAIGAKRRTILLQFLIEAATVCLLGGVIGLGITYLITLCVAKSFRFFPITVSLPVMGLAILVSLLTGLISGFLPAWRAARMNPVDALRNE